MRLIFWFAAILFLTAGGMRGQSTIRVPEDQKTIQAAIAAARDGDTVAVGAGTYDESIDFQGKSITVASVSGPQRTTIDGGMRKQAVVTFRKNEGRRTVLRGFTIRGGAGNEGGGIAVSAASPTIEGNIITENTACQGSGIGVNFGSPLIRGNQITNNGMASCGGLGGGGVLIGGDSKAEIVENLIEGNSQSEGGGISIWAGGAVTVRSNRIVNNNGTRQGGGISTVNNAPATIVNNLIAGNRAAKGGGIYWSNPPEALIHNTIADNEAQTGSALTWDNVWASTRVLNNIVSGAGLLVVCRDGGDLSGFRWNMTYAAGRESTVPCAFPEAGGNFTADPQFLDAPRLYMPKAGSRAIDAAGAASGVPESDLMGERRTMDGDGDGRAVADLGAYEFPGAGSVTAAPEALAFAPQLVSTASPRQEIRVTNAGPQALHFGEIAATGEFDARDTCRTGAGLAPGASCTVTAGFRPVSRGEKSGTLRIVSTAAGSPHSVALSGSAVGGELKFDPAVISFESQPAGVRSEPKILTVTNEGDAPAAMSGLSAEGDFEAQGCEETLEPGASCRIEVRFTPTLAGAQTAAIRIESNAAGGPHKVGIEATALAPRPVITGVDPAAVVAGGTGATLVVSGERFLKNTVARWNGTPVASAHESGERMVVTLDAGRLSAAGFIDLSVSNAEPGGGDSAGYVVEVGYPKPVITQLFPSTALAGGAGLTLMVRGSNFFSGATVKWNGSPRATTFVSRTELRAEVTAGDLAVQTMAMVTVEHPAPGGGESAGLTFSVLTPLPVPVITDLRPATMLAGSPEFILWVRGTGFGPNTTLYWNRSPRPTAMDSETDLHAAISAADVAAGGMATVTVVNPAPGGGSSAALTFTIEGNPLPVVTAVSPTSILGGGAVREVTVKGANFVEASAVKWNDADRPTRYVSANELRVTLNVEDVAVAGTGVLAVWSPPPGGGTSNRVTMQITANPLPSISSVTPARIPVRSGPLAMVVNGGTFNATTVIRINGVDRPTTYLDSYRVQTMLTDEETRRLGVLVVTVVNPPLGGGESKKRAVPVVAPAGAKDLAYDRVRGKILATVQGNASSNGNSIISIDPETGEITDAIFAGSNPSQMAMSPEGRYVYVGLDGSSAAVRVDLESRLAEAPFSLGADSFFGPYVAEDLEVMPGQPDTVAISRYARGVSPRHQGVAIYRNGEALVAKTPTHTGPNRIEFSNSGETLYGYNNETTGFGFYEMAVDGSGVRVVSTAGSLISGFGVDIVHEKGRIYATTGVVVDGASKLLLGTYTPRGTGSGSGSSNYGVAVRPDGAAGKTYILYQDRIEAFDQLRFTSLGVLDVGAGPGFGGRLIGCGENALAFSDTAGNVYVAPKALIE